MVIWVPVAITMNGFEIVKKCKKKIKIKNKSKKAKKQSQCKPTGFSNYALSAFQGETAHRVLLKPKAKALKPRCIRLSH